MKYPGGNGCMEEGGAAHHGSPSSNIKMAIFTALNQRSYR
jgi:hypothetical protein